MKFKVLNKPGLLLFSAIAGLGCGLLIRRLPASHAAQGPLTVQAKPEVFHGHLPAASDAWDQLLSHYLTDPIPPAAEGLAQSPGEEADALLRMIRQPVNAATIREGIAFLNATDAQRYWAVLPAVFARWAAQDPDAAQTAADGLRDAGARVALVWEVFSQRGMKDAAEAVRMAGTLPTSLLRAAAMNGIVDSLKPGQFPEVLQSLIQAGNPAQNAAHASLQRNILKAWAKTDPSAPLKFATGIDNPEWRAAMIQTALRIPLESDLDKEMDTATLRNLAKDSRSIAGITPQTAQLLRIGKADEILAAMPSEADRQGVLETALQILLNRLGSEGGVPEEVKKWDADGLDTLARKYEAKGQGAAFEKALLDTATRGEATLFTAAASWMTTHTPARLDELTAQAAARIPFTAAKWLTSLPPSPARDRAVAIFAETHAATDPERAAAWAESIADPAKRAATLAAVRQR